jgi:hypothetical protein
MIAKNAGIRRAAAPFVLATNIDILFSEELMRFLASRQLKENRLYRVDRCDIPAALPVTPSVPELLDFCANNVTRIYTRWGAKDARTGKFDEGSVTWKTVVHDLLTVISGDVAEKRLHTQACGDFTLLAKTRWCAIRGYAELPMLAMHIDSLACQTAYFSGAKEWILTSPRRIYHIEHSASPGWKAEGDGALMAMMNPGGIPQLGYMRYQEFAIRMRRERRPMIFNGEDWGLAGEPLPEMTVC